MGTVHIYCECINWSCIGSILVDWLALSSHSEMGFCMFAVLPERNYMCRLAVTCRCEGVRCSFVYISPVIDW